MQRILSYLLYYLLKLISFLPLWFLYIISDILAFLVHRIFGYRKKVILENIKGSFPEKSDEEINEIVRNFYQFFTDLIMESIDSFSISSVDLIDRVQIDNEEVLTQYLNAGKHVVIMVGHYGNWEWLGLRSGFVSSKHIYSLYKPLKNKTINELLITNRQRYGLGLVNDQKAYLELPKLLTPIEEGEGNGVAFIADQSARPEKAYWIDFLNRKTTFFKGPERYAKKFDCVVIYGGIRRVSRGRYSIFAKLITENPNSMGEGEMMTEFARLLEEQIQEAPPYWLWSHRRWKYTYEDLEQ